MLKIEGTIRLLAYNNSSYLWDGNWHHIIGTFDGITRKLFVDSNNVVSNSDYTGKITASGREFKLGYSDSGATYFNGLIDDVRIYNRALSAEEIQAIYNATK